MPSLSKYFFLHFGRYFITIWFWHGFNPTHKKKKNECWKLLLWILCFLSPLQRNSVLSSLLHQYLCLYIAQLTQLFIILRIWIIILYKIDYYINEHRFSEDFLTLGRWQTVSWTIIWSNVNMKTKQFHHLETINQYWKNYLMFLILGTWGEIHNLYSNFIMAGNIIFATWVQIY